MKLLLRGRRLPLFGYARFENREGQGMPEFS